jgi:hypothetical protein
LSPEPTINTVSIIEAFGIAALSPTPTILTASVVEAFGLALLIAAPTLTAGAPATLTLARAKEHAASVIISGTGETTIVRIDAGVTTIQVGAGVSPIGRTDSRALTIERTNP